MSTTDPTTPGAPSVPPAETSTPATKLEAFANSPAFPATLTNDSKETIMGFNGYPIAPEKRKEYSGVTVRQLFALHAMAKVAMPSLSDKQKKRQQFVAECFAIADEMLAQDGLPPA